MKLFNDFYIIFLFSIFSLLIISCNSNTGVTKDVKVKEDNLEIFEGKIIKVQFVDKGGRVHEDIFSYYFETNNEKLFIKIQDGKVKRDEIAKYYNTKIKIEGYKTFGLWDTDDPNVQSRVGDYIVFYKILK